MTTPETELILGLLARNMDLSAASPPDHATVDYMVGWRHALMEAASEVRRALETLRGDHA